MAVPGSLPDPDGLHRYDRHTLSGSVAADSAARLPTEIPPENRVASEQESVFLLDDRVRWRHHPPKLHLQYGMTVLFYLCSRNLSRLVTSHCRLKSCEVYPLAEAFQLASFRCAIAGYCHCVSDCKIISYATLNGSSIRRSPLEDRSLPRIGEVVSR